MPINTDEVEMIKQTIRETVNILAKAQSHIDELKYYSEKIVRNPKLKNDIISIIDRLALCSTVNLLTIQRVSHNLNDIYGALEIATQNR